MRGGTRKAGHRSVGTDKYTVSIDVQADPPCLSFQSIEDKSFWNDRIRLQGM